MPSELENALARHRRALLANERTAASEMVRAYGESWARLRVDILRLHAQIAFSGAEPTLDQAMRDARMQSIQAQIEAELRLFAPYATNSATMTQAAAIDAAMSNAVEAMELAGAPSMSIRFDKLNTGAVRAMVGYASDGSPLRALFDAIGPDVAPRMTTTLAQGIALGWGPRVTARAMRAQYGVGLTRALNISRTETMRSYRESTAQVYQANSDILEGWIWVCACTRRSCASCWAMHGSLHPLDERLDDHPNGRCAMAPKIKDRPNRIGATGAERFAELSADDQRAILGPGMYEAWKDGRVSLSPTGANSIVGRHNDPQWGTMRHARSLRDIVGAEDAKGYSAKAAGKVVPVQAAPAAARGMGPAGEPMGSKFLNIPKTGEKSQFMRDTVSAIESVHGDGPMPAIPVAVSNANTVNGTYKYNRFKDTPISITISRNGDHPNMTFAHEIGHFIDHQQANVTKSIGKHDLAGPVPPPPHIQAWKDAIANSHAMQRMKALYAQTETFKGDSGREWKADPSAAGYYLRWDEAWARSYAQYIASRSDIPTMRGQLKAQQERCARSDRYPTEWQDDDFEPIAQAIDAIFEVMGWRK